MNTINAQTLHHWLKQQEAIVIDVREPAEHASSKLEGAVLLPLGTIHADALKPYQHQKIVLQCQTGSRSFNACQQFQKLHPELKLYTLEGGLNAWRVAGLPVLQGQRVIIPLDRQVQLTIGTLLLILAGLGFVHNPLWFLGTAFMGAGLMVAGITGFCGLARIMAKMPWNQINPSPKP